MTWNGVGVVGSMQYKVKLVKLGHKKYGHGEKVDGSYAGMVDFLIDF